MRRALWMCGLLVSAGGAVVAFAMQGCGTVACSETQTCAPSSDGGGDRTTGDAPNMVPDGSPDAPGDAPVDADAGCNPNGDPATEPCVLADGFGVFVSPNGTNATGMGAGSAEQPYKTIGFALSNLNGAKRVYICATQGAYDEQVKIGTSGDGVTLLGGLSCPGPDGGASDGGVSDAGASDGGVGTDGGNGWSYVGMPQAKVAPTTAGFALEVDAITKDVHVVDMEFDALDQSAAGPGASSIAVLVNNPGAGTVAFARDRLVAGGGAAGTSVTTAPLTNWFAGDGGGQSANGSTAGGAVACNCVSPLGALSAGGTGGNGGIETGGGGSAGSATPPAIPSGLNTGQGGQGENLGTLTQCGVGYAGAFGDGGGAGSSGGLGVLTGSGWAGGSGGPGAVGNPGQGGGGGGGSALTSAAGVGGGGGACGGCGGAGAVGGGPGGASIALQVLSGVISVTRCSLVTHNAGVGGTGGTAEDGQQGGTGGASGGGCGGGNGGQGGGGGGGGGGAGGPSVGIAWTGAVTPLVEDASVVSMMSLPAPTMFTGGVAGDGGTGGPGGGAANPGALGQSGASGLAAAAAKY